MKTITINATIGAATIIVSCADDLELEDLLEAFQKIGNNAKANRHNGVFELKSGETGTYNIVIEAAEEETSNPFRTDVDAIVDRFQSGMHAATQKIMDDLDASVQAILKAHK
jgi:hypothetical protein